MAEKAAWDYLKALPDNEKFELVTICPGLILGPNLNKCNFSSGDIVCNFLLGLMPGLPRSQLQLVDIRDVAQAHLNAITIPEAAGNRFLLVKGSYWFKDMADWLIESHGKDFPSIPQMLLPYFVIKMSSYFMEDAKFAVSTWEKEPTFDNSKTKKILKIPFRDVKGSI